MITPVGTLSTTLVADFTAGRRTPLRLAAGAVVALWVHLGALWVALQCEAVLPAPALTITEVDLTPVAPPLPEPPPTPVELPTAHEALRAPKPAVRAAHREPSAAPPPAAAGALHTAEEDAPTEGEPVRFAVDASGTGYGFGVVAAGGSGGQRGGAGSPAAPKTNPGSVSGSSGDALRGFAVPPRLDESDPCRGYFPSAAWVDQGEVTLKLIVSNQGRVERATVLAEQPRGQGFGRSAVLCLQTKRFLPAQDARGQPQAAEAPVAVRFSR